MIHNKLNVSGLAIFIGVLHPTVCLTDSATMM